METLGKDVYEYLTKFGDDKDILTMLKVNKRFNQIVDEDFFKRVLRRKYPGLLNLKEKKYKNETWRKFYIKMIYYLSKIKELYDIPHINSKYFDPKDIFVAGIDDDSLYPLSLALYYFADIEDNNKLIDKFIKENVNVVYTAMYYAIKDKNINAIDYLLKKGSEIEWVYVGKTGDVNFINLMIKSYGIDVDNFDYMITGASGTLDKDLLIYLLKERKVKFPNAEIFDPFDASMGISDDIRWYENDGKNSKRQEIYKILTGEYYIKLS